MGLAAIRVAVAVGAVAAPRAVGSIFGFRPEENPEAPALARLFGWPMSPYAVLCGQTAPRRSSLSSPLFSSYRQGENRVSSSVLAVFERLVDLVARVLGEALEQPELVLVSYAAHPPATRQLVANHLWSSALLDRNSRTSAESLLVEPMKCSIITPPTATKAAWIAASDRDGCSAPRRCSQQAPPFKAPAARPSSRHSAVPAGRGSRS